MLSNLVPGDVLFIDEIHRIARPAEEMLYLAMEDFRVDVVVGKGPGATRIPLDIAPFTLVGATTRSGALTGPLRDRFGFTAHMEFYEPAELELVLRRAAADPRTSTCARTGPRRSPAGPAARRASPTGCCAGSATSPRSARTARSPAQVARAALAVYDVDELGLDRLDRAVLGALVRSFGGGPVGVSTLAVAVGEEPGTVEEVCEPYLVRAGMLARTPGAGWRRRRRGRTSGCRGAAGRHPGGPSCAVLTGRAGRLGGHTDVAERRRSWNHSRLLFPLLILLLFIPIFLSGRKQRRQMQEMQQLQSALEPGDVVITTSGLRGTVVDASYEDTVDLEIADGVVTTWLRAAVASKVPAEPRRRVAAEIATSDDRRPSTPPRAGRATPTAADGPVAPSARGRQSLRRRTTPRERDRPRS